jgi:hypothetical protein
MVLIAFYASPFCIRMCYGFCTMNDFAKLVGRFFARDLLYFIAGSNIILAFMIGNVYGWKLDQLFSFLGKIPTTALLPIGVAAYVLAMLLILGR